MQLDVNDIFVSIDGEVNYWGQGRPTVFVRLSNCNLRCSYCDTKQTWKQGTVMSTEEVVDKVKAFGINNITITGGEPLLQRDSLKEFISKLCFEKELDCFINIETNGTQTKLDFEKSIIKENICYTIDYKQEVENYVFVFDDVFGLDEKDTIKFVIQNRKQYEQAVKLVRTKFGVNYVRTAFSPVNTGLDPKQLVQWMIEDKLNKVLLNCQLHKYLSIQ